MTKKKSFLLCALFLAFVTVFVTSCSQTPSEENLWDTAVYKSDTEFGKGEKTVTVSVTVEEHTVNFTIHTDKEILGEALMEHDLVSGEQGAYGLYIKKVNGIVADYDINQSYWSFTKNGEYMTQGVDGITVKDGEQYELTYTKGQ